ncbi:AsmA-like C-terminal domain-containing protein [Roseibium sediminis]|uniref:AsmA-like C-terminal domain-containing protein n=1 Tax=Roseibium sediminis TaxID=1775174 RepID=UPI00123D287F|nr:AsmA-like C-terminal domain-containing protein [Roseibium sediminis]
MTNANSTEPVFRKPKRRWLRLLVWCVVAALLVFLLYAAVRLGTGPVRLPFAPGLVERFVGTETTSASVSGIELDLTAPDGPSVLVLDADVSVSGTSAGHVFIPSVEIVLEPDALWAGNIQAHRIDIQSPRIEVSVQTPEDAPVPSMQSVTELANVAAQQFDESLQRLGVQQIKISNADVTISGPFERSFSGIDLNIGRQASGQVQLMATINGNNGPWYIQAASASLPIGRRLLLRGSDLTIKEFAGPDRDFQAGKGAGLPFQLQFDSMVDPDGKFGSSEVAFRSRNGWLQVGRATVSYDDVALSLGWNREFEGVRLNELRYQVGLTDINLAGEFKPPLEGEQEWTYRIRSNYSAIGPIDINHPPHVVESAAISGRLSLEERAIYFDDFSVRSGKAGVQGAGSLQIGKEGPYLALAIDAEKVPVVMAQQLWPITLVPPARQWVIDHVKDGLVESASFIGAIQPPAFDRSNPDPGWKPEDLSFQLAFTDAVIAPIGDVPDATGIDGSVEITDGRLLVKGADGVIEAVAVDGKPVAIPRVTFAIPNVRIREGKVGELDVDLSGPVRGIANVVNSEPFHVLEKADVTSDGVIGSGTMNLKASFSVDNKVRLADVDWKAIAKSANFTSPSPILGHSIKNANITLEAQPSHVSILGVGQLDGLKANIDLVLPLGGSSVAGRQDVGVEINAQQLKKRGVDLTDFLSGPLRLEIQKDGDAQSVSVDLRKTKVSISALGWTKEAGVPAKASFLLKAKDDGQKVEDFVLEADGVSVLGSMAIDGKGVLRTASFSKFQLRPDDNLSLSIQRTDRGTYKVAMVGDQLDARGLIRQIKAPGTQGGQGDFQKGISVTANIGKVIGYNAERIDDFTGSVEISGSDINGVQLSGQMKGGSPFRFVMEPFAKGRTVNGQFGNSGAMLSFLDVFNRMRGGQGELDVVLSSDTQWTGQFKVRQLAIANDPALERLRKRGTGRNGVSDPGKIVIHSGGDVKGADASFETLDIEFVRVDDHIDILRGALQGAVFGGTIAGKINLTNQTLDMSGTFVPIYALNNIFAKIPILGFALGGGSNEGGLIGVTYKLSGAVADPTLTVNPVSAIAPGIFRRMFEFQQ